MSRIVPGAREAGAQTHFAGRVAGPAMYVDSTSTMDAATIADRQREGGGGPSQRRRDGAPSLFRRLLKRFV
jgi:hypothetical protein